MSEMTPEEKLNYIIGQQAEVITRLDSNIEAVVNKTYPNISSRLIQTSLEQSYVDIINQYSDSDSPLNSISAVGMKVILKPNDTINRNGNRLFYLDGNEYTEVTTDSLVSAATEGNTEVAIVWFFANNGNALDLSIETSVYIFELDARSFTENISLHSSYTAYTKKISSTNIHLSVNNALACFEFNEYNRREMTTSDKIPTSAVEYYSEYTSIPNLSAYADNNHSHPIAERTNLKKITMPFLTTISSFTGSPARSVVNAFSDCNNANLKISFPNLITISDVSNNTSVYSPFRNVNTVELPATLNYLGRKACDLNHKIILHCVNASTIHTGWCLSTPSELFAIDPNWAATINIAVAAANWDIDDFTNLIGGQTNGVDNLRTMTTDTVKQLTVPAAIFTQLNAANSCTIDGYTDKSWVEYADEVKHWTIIGA